MSVKKIYKVEAFSAWAENEGISDAALLGAIEEMDRGLIDANLGGNLYKKRIPLSGRGKSGGGRVILATRWERRWFFLFGFSKNERDNISKSELRSLKVYARDLLSQSNEALRKAVADGYLKEVKNG